MAIFGKKIRNDGLTGVVIRSRDVYAAAVSRARGALPRLEALQALHFEEDADAAKLQTALEKPLGQFHASTLLDYDNYQLLLVEAPDVRPEELRSAVRWRIKDLLGFHIDDAIIDVFEIPDQRHQHRNHMMYVVAAKANAVQSRAEFLANAGLTIDVVDIPEMALRNLAMLLDEEQQGIALLHLDDTRGVITLSRQGTLYLTRRWDIGLDQIHHSHDAEQRIRHFENILLEIQRSLDYYDSHFPHGAIRALVLTPSAKAAEGLEDFLKQNLDIAVQALELGAHIEGVPGQLSSGELLAIGAALRQEERAL